MNFDTNILIAYINGDKIVVDFILNLKNTNQPCFISNIVEAEMLSLKTLNEEDLKMIKNFINENFIVINADRNVTQKSAEMRRSYSKIKLPDAIVLATSFLNGYPLCTRDIFEKVKIKEVIVINI